ncbi:hypothetical protein CPB84DRAFT_1772557 [Gymnopilus junonius]|uniref:PIN-like protein n=1 Tax=Gymnopilus junonius TaxID=109634 RepID=A0A9P5NRZ2_GYMJU|nr:hypothetical protein CPB84DRAFT_1772557 [Gymnopilus junonius]
MLSSVVVWILSGLVIAWLKKVPSADVHELNHVFSPTITLVLALLMASLLAGGIGVILHQDFKGYHPIVNLFCLLFFCICTSWSPANDIRKQEFSEPIPNERISSLNGELLTVNWLTMVNGLLYSTMLWYFLKPLPPGGGSGQRVISLNARSRATVNPATIEDGAA